MIEPFHSPFRGPIRSPIRSPVHGRALALVRGLARALRHLAVPAFLLGAGPALADEACRDVTHRGEDYWVCSFSPAEARVTMHLRGEDGEPYRRIGNATRALGPALMSMNGGMYRRSLSPVGLYVEGGEEREALVVRDGWGNFHLLPNGVFHVSEGEGEGGAQTFGVTETTAYEADPPDAAFATQSGPMLVIDGALHPRFLPRSDSLKVRNGVGVSADGRVHFAISRGRVRFHDFGTLFRDRLETPNALFLDGTISAFEAGRRRRSTFMPIGPIIRVTARGDDDTAIADDPAVADDRAMEDGDAASGAPDAGDG